MAVKARAPFQAAPITMPIAASSSSAWTTALRRLPSASTWNLRACFSKASASEVEGVIGYQAATVAPAKTQPSPAASLPEIMILPLVSFAARTLSGNGSVKVLKA